MPKAARPSTPSAAYGKRRQDEPARAKRSSRSTAPQLTPTLQQRREPTHPKEQKGRQRRERPMLSRSQTHRLAALAQQKSKTAAQLNKLKELHAHCGELVLTVEAEDSTWRKLYRTKQRNYNRLAERFGSTTTKLADAEEEAEREHEANEQLQVCFSQGNMNQGGRLYVVDEVVQDTRNAEKELVHKLQQQLRESVAEASELRTHVGELEMGGGRQQRRLTDGFFSI
eukprot:jgi/Tetstr1/456791/TSEL_043465.t1